MYHISKSSRIAITIAATATLVVIGTLSSAMAEEPNVEPASHGAWYRLNDDRDTSQQSLEILVSSRRARTKAVEAGMSIDPAGSAQRVDAERGGERELDKWTRVIAAPARQIPRDARWINVADTSSRHREVNPTEPLIASEAGASPRPHVPGQFERIQANPSVEPLAEWITGLNRPSPIMKTWPTTKDTKLAQPNTQTPAGRRLDSEAPLLFPSAEPDSGQLLAEVYTISVGTHDVQQTQLPSDQHLQALITEMFPDCDLLLATEDESLVITGAASNDAEAVRIVSFVRSLRLVPVIDQLKVQR